RSDSSHPATGGSLLAACVIYGALSGEDPRSANYVPLGVSASEAEQLKTIAAEVLNQAHAPVAMPAPGGAALASGVALGQAVNPPQPGPEQPTAPVRPEAM